MTCCCSLAGTKACDNCGSKNYQVGTYTFTPKRKTNEFDENFQELLENIKEIIRNFQKTKRDLV